MHNDRIFEILGINYRLNQWYINKVKEKLGTKYDPNLIKPLTVINIDTLIYCTPQLIKNDANFINMINEHLDEMRIEMKVHPLNEKIAEENVNQSLGKQLSPISKRVKDSEFPIQLLLEKFKNVCSD